jgi:peptide chain release factor 2
MFSGGLFDLEGRRAILAELERRMGEEGFWNDPETASKVSKEASDIKDSLNEHCKMAETLDDLEVLAKLAEEDDDPALLEETQTALLDLEKEYEEYELRALLSGEYDRANTIMTLHAGAGGTEAQDWASMLFRMYARWCEGRGFKYEVLDILPGEEAGVKSVTLLIKGDYAYGYLKAEKGVHRLVRISPFDASARRHTSFASVEVLPELEQDKTVQINSEDLRIDTYRSSGAGGQHVNKTDSAVRITHIPTGIVVQCQNERSQHANRLTAMKILQSKLLDLKLQEQKSKMEELKGEHGEIAWGNQIRSYVFQPYSLVKDHRTGLEVGNVQAVMDGDIDPFIYAFLKEEAMPEERRS